VNGFSLFAMAAEEVKGADEARRLLRDFSPLALATIAAWLNAALLKGAEQGVGPSKELLEHMQTKAQEAIAHLRVHP